MKLDPKFAHLQAPDAPRMVTEALRELGTIETPGAKNNTKIVGWADEVAALCKSPYNKWAADFYNADSIAWCGLFMAVVAARAAQGRPERFPPDRYLSALAWAQFGTAVPVDQAAVGDVMVIIRPGGGHVTLNAGTVAGGASFYGLGGNQGDAVTIVPFAAARVTAVRRPPYMVRPAGAKRVYVAAGGKLSTDEA